MTIKKQDLIKEVELWELSEGSPIDGLNFGQTLITKIGKLTIGELG